MTSVDVNGTICGGPLYTAYHVTLSSTQSHPVSARGVGPGINMTMDQCCEIKTNLPAHQRRLLHLVLWLNSLMFIAEFGAGVAAHSTALLADSVDMLDDAIVYGFSLYAAARCGRHAWHCSKGFALGVLIDVSHKLIAGVVPAPGVIEHCWCVRGTT